MGFSKRLIETTAGLLLSVGIGGSMEVTAAEPPAPPIKNKAETRESAIKNAVMEHLNGEISSDPLKTELGLERIGSEKIGGDKVKQFRNNDELKKYIEGFGFEVNKDGEVSLPKSSNIGDSALPSQSTNKRLIDLTKPNINTWKVRESTNEILVNVNGRNIKTKTTEISIEDGQISNFPQLAIRKVEGPDNTSATTMQFQVRSDKNGASIPNFITTAKYRKGDQTYELVAWHTGPGDKNGLLITEQYTKNGKPVDENGKPTTYSDKNNQRFTSNAEMVPIEKDKGKGGRY